MSFVPWAKLQTQFNKMADELIDTINATPVTCYYQSQSSMVAPQGDTTQLPSILDQYGGRQPLNAIEGNEDRTAGSSGYVLAFDSETITARTYWIRKSAGRYKPDDPNTGYNVYNQQMKIISYTDDNDKLKNASYIVVSGIKLKNIELPKPQSFGRRYSSSFWEAIDG